MSYPVAFVTSTVVLPEPIAVAFTTDISAVEELPSFSAEELPDDPEADCSFTTALLPDEPVPSAELLEQAQPERPNAPSAKQHTREIAIKL
jgi:hypothetical protein